MVNFNLCKFSSLKMRAFHMLSIFRGFQMTCKPILHLSIFSCLDALFWKAKNFGGTFVFLRTFLRISKKFFLELKTTHRTLNERTIFQVRKERRLYLLRQTLELRERSRWRVPQFVLFVTAMLTLRLLYPLI